MEGGIKELMPSGQSVDQRIVEMRIDNKKFESGAKTTISTLEKLDKALKLKSDSKAIDDMQRSMDRFDGGNMTRSLEKVSLSFSALEVAGLRVIQNLTDSVYNFVAKTVKGLTIDQVSEGFNKYEKMIESTQTIMAATAGDIGEGKRWADQAEQMTEIQRILDGLLWYADETSYSFTDMTDNLGKFLSAGQDLDDAYKAMMGISSWGATAGAKPAEVARAMYNISQAMGTGAMKAIDWKSIENANMATLEFKQNAIDVAVAQGKLKAVINETGDAIKEGYVAMSVKTNEAGYVIGKTDDEVEDMLVTATNFRDSLQSGWFDSEVMAEVFEKYGRFADLLQQTTSKNYGKAVTSALNEQGEAIEGLVGSGLEATEMLQLLDEYRMELADPKKKVNWDEWLDSAALNGTTEEQIDQLKQLVQALDNVGIAYSETGFRMGQEAKTFTDAILATKDAVSSQWMKSFQYIFGDYMQAKELWTDVTGALWEAFASGGEKRNKVLEIWSRSVDEFGRTGRDYLFGHWEEEIDGETVEVQGALWNLLDAVSTFTEPIKEAFDEVFGLDKKHYSSTAEALRDLSRRFQQFTASLGFNEEAQNGLKVAFKAFFTVIKSGIKVIGGVVVALGKLAYIFGDVINGVASVTSALADFIHGDITFEEFAQIVRDTFSSIGESITETIKNMIPTEEQLLDFFERAKNKYQEVKRFFQEDFTWGNIKQLLPSFDGIREKLQSIGSYLMEKYPQIFQMFEDWKQNHAFLASVLDGIGSAFRYIADGISNVKFNSELLNGILEDISSFISFIFGDPTELKQKISTFFSALWEGIKTAVKEVKIADILESLKTAGLLMFLAELVRLFHFFANAADLAGELLDSAGVALESLAFNFRATAYIKMAVAIGILAGALWLLATKVPEDKLVHVVAAMSLLIAMLTVFAKNMNGIVKVIGNRKTFNFIPAIGGILIGFAALLAGVASVILIARRVEPGKLIGIAVGLLGFLAIMAVIATKMGGIEFKSPKGVVGSILAFSLAIGMLIPIMIVLGVMPWAAWGRALMGLMGTVAILGGAMWALSALKIDGSNMLKLSGSLAIMSLALDSLIPLMLFFAVLPVKAIGKGIAGLVVSMLALAGMAFLISKIKVDGKSFLMIAGGIALLALAINLIAPALIKFTVVISAIGAIIPKITKAFGGFGKALLGMLAGLILLVGFTVALALFSVAVTVLAIGLGILAISLVAVSATLPTFVDAMIKLSDNAGKMFKAVLVLVALGAAFAAIAFAISKLSGTNFGKTIKSFGDNVTKAGGTLITSVMTTLSKFGTSLITFIKNNTESILKVLKGVVVVIGLFMISIIPNLVDSFIEAVLVFFNSAAESLRANQGALLHAVTNMLEAILEVIITGITWLLGSIGRLIVDGIGDLITFVIDKIIDSVQNAGFLSDIAALFGINVDGMIAGLENAKNKIGNWGDSIFDMFEGIGNTAKEYSKTNFIAPDAEFIPIAPIMEAEKNKLRLQETLEETEAMAKSIDTSSLVVNNQSNQEALNGTAESFTNMTTSVTDFGEASQILGSIDLKSWAEEHGIDPKSLVNFNELELASLVKSKMLPAGEAIDSGTAQGVAENIHLVTDSVGQMGDQAADATMTNLDAHSPSRRFATIGETIPAGLADGIKNSVGSATAAISALSNRVLSSANGVFRSSGPVAGSNAVVGLANGVYKNLQTAYNAGAAAGNAFMRGYDNATKTKSPSREMMKRGMYAIQGLLLGLQNNEDSIYDESANIGYGMINTLQSAMAQVAMFASEEFDISPVITPVVDLSNVEAAAGSVNGSLYAGKIGLSGEISGSISRRMNQIENLAANMQSAGSTTYQGDNVTINVYPSQGMDEIALADMVMDRMQTRMVRREVAFG